MSATFNSHERNFPENKNRNGEVVVSVTNVSKKFCKNLRRSMSYGIADLSKNFFGIKPDSTALRRDEFWAIEDISFELRKGEVIGIIGLNGSGKSTLLRVLAGILPPDNGEVKIKGRVGALIAVGAGFHPHMSGRENIFLNGTILGMSRREIRSRFNDIVDFAEIGDFLDAPVATYSSGMRVRLGFSIAVHVDPDITLIDEVLAVGDFNFRRKCSERINELRRHTATIFVSHNMRDVLSLCSETIVLNKGKVYFKGDTQKSISSYLNLNKNKDYPVDKTSSEDSKFEALKNLHQSIYGNIYHNAEKIMDVRHRWVDETGKPVDSIDHGSSITLEFSFKLLKDVNRLIIGVPIYSDGNLITASNTDANGSSIAVRKNGWVRGRLVIENVVLNPGTYVPLFAVVDTNEFLYRNFTGNFKVCDIPFSFGYVTLDHHWNFEI